MSVHPMLAIPELRAKCENMHCAKDYKRACREALDEFRQQTGLRLWYRYRTIGDSVIAEFDRDTGEMTNVIATRRGFPAGCIVAFVYDKDLYLGSSFCCRRDRHSYSKDVGRWCAVASSKLVKNWHLGTSLYDSAIVAQQFDTISNRVAIVDFHQWLCRNKLMLTEMSEALCSGQKSPKLYTVSNVALAS